MRFLVPTIALAALMSFAGCQPGNDQPLPILGIHDYSNGDTVYHQIGDFRFIDQDSQIITPSTFDNKIYIADFFFISCPTICPKVKKQMMRIQDKFGDEDRLMMISHSIDTKRDTVGRLRSFADKLDINTEQWRLVTGVKDEIYEIADDYLSVAIENPEAPGGFDHSGRLILVDENKLIRSFCDGTDPADVDRFMKDIKKLLAE